MADEGINLALNQETPAQQPLIDLFPNQTPSVSDDVATKRAAKATFGLSDKIPITYGDYLKSIQNGQENDLRKQVASSLDYQKAINRYDQIQQFARSKGEALTQADVDQIDAMQNFNGVPNDPRSVFEQSFSKQYIDVLRNTPGVPGSWFDNLVQQSPELVNQVSAVGEEFLAKKEYARTQRENAEAASQQQSYFGDVIDRAKELVPGYVEYNLRGNVNGESAFQGLLGTQLQNEATALLRLPMDKYKNQFDAIMKRLTDKDPALGITFAHAVEGMSLGDTTINNAFTALDLSSYFGIGKSVALGVRGLAGRAADSLEIRQLTRAVREQAQSAVGTETAPPSVVAHAAAGNLGEAAVQQATADIAGLRSGATDASKVAMDELNSFLVAQEDQMRATHGRYGQEIVNRVLENARTFRTNLMEAISNIARVERLPEITAVQTAIRAVKDDILNQYRGLRSSIVDINSFLNLEGLRRNDLTNTYDVVMRVGRATGEYFASQAEAEGSAFLYDIANPTIKQQGLGYYIELSKPLNETSKVSRDFLLSTKAAKDPDTYVNAFLGFLRTTDDTLSLEQRLNRKVAAYGGSNLLKVAKEEAKHIRNLTKWAFPGTDKRAIFHQWESAVKFAREREDPLHPGQKGYFFQSPAELGGHYNTHFGRPPTEGETQAYFAYVRLVEMDAVLRDIGLYRNMSRVGTEHHKVFLKDASGNTIDSGFFPGIRQTVFPIGSDPIAVLGDTAADTKIGVVGGRGFNPKFINTVRDEIEAGVRQVIRIWDPETRPLTNLLGGNNSRIRYVVTNKLETKPLPYTNLSRRGGGHFDYDYDFYVKQARVNFDRAYMKHVYEGDSTIMPISNRALGRDVAQALDEVRIALLSRDRGAAQTVAQSKIPAIPFREIESWFKPSRDPNGNPLPPRLNLREPIQVIPKGSTIASQDSELAKRSYYRVRNGKPLFYDGTTEGSDARQFQIKYTGERDAYDLYTIRDTGTRHNPLWSYEPAKLIDPIPTLNRGIKDITSSFFMDDYKVFSVEHWLKQAAPHLKLDSPDAWQSSPFWHFLHAKFKNDANPIAVRQLEDARFKIQQFVGTPSKLQNALNSVSQDLADSMYKRFGPGGNQLTRGLILAPSWAVARLTRPVDFLHYATYNAVIGLWSLPQLLVQSMTYITIAGEAGLAKAGQGALGALLHQYSRLNQNPAILRTLDNIAVKMGFFKPGEWIEAQQLLNRTGFQHIGGEHALIDNHYAPKLISNGLQNFLDAGTIFFKGAERNARFGAWYTAYKEFRATNPTGRITNNELRSILERADILSGNMSRASKARLQYGVMSFPAQFLGYQIRLAELFLGRRLGETALERTANRARLLATFAAMYGVPTAAGIAALPLTDWWRQKAIENGYVVGNNWLSTTFNEGIPAMLGQLATGNVYDIGQRYGAPGMDIIRETLTGDKGWWNILGGASWSVLSGAFEGSNGFRAAMMSMIRGDNQAFPLTAENLTEPFRVISSVSNAYKVMAAINTGRWLTRNESYLDNTSPLNALFMGVTGLQTQQAADITRVTWSLKDRKDMQEYGKKQFIKYFQRAVKDQEHNPDLAREEFKQGLSFLVVSGFPEEKYAEAISEAIQAGDTTLIDRLNWDMYLKNVPPDQRDAYMRTFNTINQNNRNR